MTFNKICLIVLGMMVAVIGCDTTRPLQEARNWATSMGMKDANIDCVNYDSDGDGYVSCTVSERKPDGSLSVIALECASAYTGFLNGGCRLQRPGVVNR